jgi:hypothetical protein
MAASVAVMDAAYVREPAQRVAERIVDAAQRQIVLLRSAREDDLKTAPANALNIGHSIAQLREAMEPFREGWVDLITAFIADWPLIDAALAKRHEALKSNPRRLPEEDARFIANLIFVIAYETARLAGFELAEADAELFTAAALKAAEVNCPDIHEHPGRFREFMNPAAKPETTERS